MKIVLTTEELKREFQPVRKEEMWQRKDGTLFRFIKWLDSTHIELEELQ